MFSLGENMTEISAVFIHSALCLTTGPKPLSKRALHIVRSKSFLLQMWVSSPFFQVATGWTVRGSNPGGGARYSAPVQTGPGAHPPSYTMGTESFPGVKRPRHGFDHPPHLESRLKKKIRDIILHPSRPLWPVTWWILYLPLLSVSLYAQCTRLHRVVTEITTWNHQINERIPECYVRWRLIVLETLR
jgi:hypothetical protein